LCPKIKDGCDSPCKTKKNKKIMSKSVLRGRKEGGEQPDGRRVQYNGGTTEKMSKRSIRKRKRTQEVQTSPCGNVSVSCTQLIHLGYARDEETK